jgi:hypothetical protein
MAIHLRRHGVSGQVQEEVTGVQTPRVVLEKRLALAHEMLSLAVKDTQTLPLDQHAALVEILRRLTRIREWVATHEEGESL